MTRYTLTEDGYPHTTGLKLNEVEEMIERHTRFFPEIEWVMLPENN